MAPSHSEPASLPPRRPPHLPSLPAKRPQLLDPLQLSPDFVHFNLEDQHSPLRLPSEGLSLSRAKSIVTPLRNKSIYEMYRGEDRVVQRYE